MEARSVRGILLISGITACKASTHPTICQLSFDVGGGVGVGDDDADLFKLVRLFLIPNF